jgi:hypothetical protein
MATHPHANTIMGFTQVEEIPAAPGEISQALIQQGFHGFQ